MELLHLERTIRFNAISREYGLESTTSSLICSIFERVARSEEEFELTFSSFVFDGDEFDC